MTRRKGEITALIRTAVALRTEAKAGRPRSVGPASLAVLPPMDELASPGR